MVHIHGLRSLGIETIQYGSVFIPVLMSKLPDGVCLRVVRENHEETYHSCYEHHRVHAGIVGQMVLWVS